ncbi:MAG: amidase [Gammaproteobacteria bacterium]|jgi:Asp-tRNA(Asn)/Glu-tRNA(Gln) amidotransferase A subunit family amidase|nr:amidase [Gammaproteobacteria bacterium]
MVAKQPNELTALEALSQIRAGTLTSEALVAACLRRIEERESTVGAWNFLSPEQALDAARGSDKVASDGPFRGLPVAVKDIFDTADMPTAYGSPIYEGYRPPSDASSVALVRAAGGVILGKTVSTEFAYFKPGKTANPHNPAHTPGGSSSGSAAAVADFMTPLAFGSQTVGSIIRPASYCGVVGYKPSYGLIDRTGVRPLADTFDTVGVLTRSVPDAAYFVSVLSRRPTLRLDGELEAPPSIGVCPTHEWPAADEDAAAALETAARLASDAGGQVRETVLPELFAVLGEAQGLIVDYETANSAAYELAFHRDNVSKTFLDRAEAGLAYTADQYDDALCVVARAQTGLDAAMDGVDVLLCPSSQGQAPEGLGTTGDPIFNRMGTALRAPCVNIPGLSGRSGLPVGVQVMGRMKDDRRTLAVGNWLHGILRRG